MEDCQPNEVRLDRKGKSTVPAIKVVRRGGYRGSFRGFDSGRGRPPNRPFNPRNFAPHTVTSPSLNHSNNVSSLNASGRSVDHVKLEPLGNLRQLEQRPPKRTKFSPQQFPSRESQSSERYFPRRGLPRTNISPLSQYPKGISGNHEAQAVFTPYEAMQNDRTVLKKQVEVVQSELSSGRVHVVRKRSQRDESANNTRQLAMGHTSGYDGETPEVIPIEDAGSSAARIPKPAKSSTLSSSEVVLDSCSTDVAMAQTRSFPMPGKQRAFPSRVVPPPEEIIDLTVDPPDVLVNIPLAMPTRFFRSGVLKIKLASSRTPSTMDVTSTAEQSVLRDSVSDDNDPLMGLIGGEGCVAAKSREEPTHASSRTLPNDQNELLPVIPALILSPAPGPSRVPLDAHDKPRRVLIADWNSTLISVSMHGFVESLDMPSLVSRHNLCRPTAPAQESVDDACILHTGDSSVVVLAHAREEKQISYLISQTCRGTSRRVVDRPWNKTKKGGTSVVSTMMQPLMFASGGHDHAVHLWNLSEDLKNVSSTLLAIKHTSVIQSLLPIRDTSHKLISAGADCNVHLWDLSSERVVHTFKTSNSPYHAHKTESPFCTLLEVGHRDLQFELRDHRMVPEHPAERFGFYTTELHGRFIKGDTWSHFFASGSRNGCVRLWDLRNVRKQPAFVSCFSNDQVVQVLKTESDLLAFSKRGDVMKLTRSHMNA